MNALHLISAILVGCLTAPVALGMIVTVLCRGKGFRRRDTPTGLVIHAFARRSLLDCSYVPVRILNEFLRLAAGSARWLTVRAAATGCATTAQGEPGHVLTFDDGLEEIYTSGMPVLERHGVKSTVFVVAGAIGKQTDAGDIHGRQRFLSASQIAEIARAGHEIGSHTMTHADLTMLSDQRIRDELVDSKHRLEDACGQAVTSIAFPYGSWNRRVWSQACDAGYSAATVLRPGHGHLPAGMIPVYGAYAFDTPSDLAAKTLGWRAPTAFARAQVMSQFARGGPLWRFSPGCRLKAGTDGENTAER